MPGTGPVRVETLPRVIVVAVTPTSVAPPLPPSGAAAPGFGDTPAPVPLPVPLAPALSAPVAAADGVPSERPRPASVPVPVSVPASVPPTLRRWRLCASATRLGLTRNPQ